MVLGRYLIVGYLDPLGVGPSSATHEAYRPRAAHIASERGGPRLLCKRACAQGAFDRLEAVV